MAEVLRAMPLDRGDRVFGERRQRLVGRAVLCLHGTCP
ncbi:hypothetical protein FBZ83_10477 [Azospirillum brasilense]|uniref:Uncharacterized protein n=1 Tax=Azospirillum brasilense TaxID=192 RepID=A0A560CIV5_AZOBR|nr:hypothetical protein FBZ83_10477 [Azospirillum brasilense]